MTFVIAALILSALYCAGMYGFLAYLTFRDQRDYETETFHLGLCFILSVGFLGLVLKGAG